jgi:hypothetical protein
MTDCFIAIVKTLDEVWLFGDAFDECTDWNDLWHFLSTTTESRCQGLRFSFTSRLEGYIRDALGSLGVASVDMNCDGVNKDIEDFVSGSLSRDIRFTRTPQEGKAMVRESLIHRANGMYVHFMASLMIF